MKKLLLSILLFLPMFLQAQDVSMQDFNKSLEAEFRALKTAEAQRDKKTQGQVLGKIGGIYLDVARQPSENISAVGLVAADKKANLAKSIEYSNKSIEASESVGDIEQLKTSYKNLNAAQKMAGRVKDAVASYAKLVSLKKNIFTAKKTGEIEKNKLEYEHAKREDSIRKEQQLAEERLKEQQQRLAQQQQQLEATNKTLTAAEKAKQDADAKLQKTQTDLTQEKNLSVEKDKKLTEAEQEKALQTANMELQQNKLLLQQNELKMKDNDIEQRKKQTYFYIYGIIALVIICILAFRSFHIQKKSNQALTKEKKRSEELLLNILPQEVAEELMEKGFADAKHFYDVTVLFTDFVSFTSLAETMSPKELVGELHVCFKAFDGILSKYHIEKIKTVGDAYMAVAGLPIANPNHAADIAAAAIEIRDFMTQRKKEMGNGTFGVRIGINSGNVVAGIVGVRKFSYDIWGDTVNIAARMEQNSEEGKINISDSTYQLLKDKYACIYRGKVDAKNKGNIDMYYLTN